MKRTTEDFEALTRCFPDGWEDAASKFGIRFGRRTGSKLANIEELLRLFFHQVANELSLSSAVAWAAASGLPEISAVALHKRVRKLGPYLRWILEGMLAHAEKYAPQRWGGYELRVVDGSTVVRPGHDRATARLLYVMRLSDLRLTEVHVTDDKVGETYDRLENVTNDQIYIADRAYSSPPGIAALHARGGDVLVRLNWASLPLYQASRAPFDIFEKLTTVSAKRIRSWNVRIKSGSTWVPGRVVVQALPPGEAKTARQKLKKENRNASANSLAAAGYRMVFTTADADRLPDKAVLELYSQRWQVELQIKRDKSIFGLKCLPNYRLDTIESWLYGKLILAQLTRRIADDAIGDLPPCEVSALEAA